MLHRRKFLGLLAACPLCAQAARAAEGAHWDYEGARGVEKWGEIDPAYKVCAVGCEQSPIDLEGAIRARFDRVALDWKPQAYTVANNGHTIQAAAQPGSTLRLGDQTYELKQFHFHTPSEHAIDGRKTAMEAHFVHAQGDRLAVVGVFLTGGGANAAFSKVMAVAPATEGEAKLPAPIDVRSLLPKKGPLYRYEGSLTIPPCSENVGWNIYGRSVAVADKDIEAFKKLFPNNARPFQPRNRRFLLREG